MLGLYLDVTLFDTLYLETIHRKIHTNKIKTR